MKKNQKILIRVSQLSVLAASLILIVLSAWNIFQNISKYHNLETEAKLSKQRVEKVQKEYLNSKKQLEDKINLQINSENELVREIADHNNNYTIMDNLSKEFFKVYFTWDDINSYQDRGNKLKNIASESLLNNKTIFDDGKDSTGGDSIKALGLKSNFESSEVSVVDDKTSIVKVKYDKGNDDKATSVKFFLVDYDISNQKINNLKAIFSSDIVSQEVK